MAERQQEQALSQDPAEASQSSSADEREDSPATSSSSDEDEKQRLAQRGAWASKHAVPQPTVPGGKTRTRTNRFPKIPRSERCGSCENCLNPQRKKACLVARQRMEKQLEGHQGAAARPMAGSKAGTAVAPPSVPAAQDPFTRSLTSILSSSGGVVQERHAGMLLQLVKRAKTKPHRTALLVVLQLSSPEVLRQAVAAKLLLDLQLWLSEFIAEGRQALVQKTLACVDKLPVTMAALQPPCELGKIVGRLRKHESFGSPVIEPAKRLVARWKAMVEQRANAGSTPASGSSTASAAAAKRMVGTALAEPLDRKASTNLSVTEDGDLFKTTDKQRTGIKDAVPAVKKLVTIKTIAMEATRGKAADSSLPANSPRAMAVAKEPTALSKLGSTGNSITSVQTEVGKVSASPFVSLGSLGSGVTVLGGGISSGLSASLSTVGPGSGNAKERAAVAAQRVPSPEPQPRKEKKKKLSWQTDEAIVGVRWFRKDDPPAAAQQDVDSAELPSGGTAAATVPDVAPPGFESAAKKEHLSEAAALRRHRAEEDQERLALDQGLARMMATTAWLNPLENDAMSEAELATMPTPPARGEGSTEALHAASRRQQEPAAVYAQLSAVPASPGEPSSTADCGQMQHPATIPRIPLSLEAAVAMQQQQRLQGRSMQQQQQQPQGLSMQPVLHSSMQHLGRSDQQQQQMVDQQAAAPPVLTAAVPDIGAALAQLAASGVLNTVAGSAAGSSSLQPQPQQPAMAVPIHAQPGEQQQDRGHPHAPSCGYPWQQAGPGRQSELSQQHPSHPPPPRRAYNQRPCRYFNTPQGCYMGDRCNFAHNALPGIERGRGSGGGRSAKRPAEEGGDGWQGSFAKRGRGM